MGLVLAALCSVVVSALSNWRIAKFNSKNIFHPWKCHPRHSSLLFSYLFGSKQLHVSRNENHTSSSQSLITVPPPGSEKPQPQPHLAQPAMQRTA